MSIVSLDFTDLQAPSPALTLSAQQERVMEWVREETGNALIIAVAGSGKTTTLIEAISEMSGSIAFAAYNKRIADEIKEKVLARGLAVQAKVATFHSFGFTAWRRLHPQVKVDGYKVNNIVEELDVPEDLQEFVTKLVSMVRQSGVGITCPVNLESAWDEVIAHYGLDELLTEGGRRRPQYSEEEEVDDQVLAKRLMAGKFYALKVLRASIEQADEVIDFDDQLYMPLYAKAYIDQYDWVLIDEAQDSNPLRRGLAAAMLKPGGRLLAVGDPAQAIYGFTGADSESLDNIREQFDCIDLPLTVSYRCPKAVVRHAQRWVSHIEAAPSAPEGYVGTVDYLQDFLPAMPDTPRQELEKSVVLCRKNAPLVDLAFALIRQHIPCHVEGRDIGKQIKDLATKWKRITELQSLQKKVQEYKVTQVARFMSKKQEQRADAVADRCDTLLALILGLLAKNPHATVADLKGLCDSLFGDNLPVGLTLSSIHKSKGREWETVYWLGRNAWQPSPFAQQEWQLAQEHNLCYVAATRAKDTLVELIVPEKRRGWEE